MALLLLITLNIILLWFECWLRMMVRPILNVKPILASGFCVQEHSVSAMLSDGGISHAGLRSGKLGPGAVFLF